MIRMLVPTLAVVLAVGLVPAGVGAAQGRGDAVDGRYIVVLDAGEPQEVADEHARDHGARVRHVYRHALRGYAATMSQQAAGRVSRDARVAYVEADRVVTTAHHECGHSGGPPGSGTGSCDPGDVYGTVTDADSGAALEGATVTVDTGQSDDTDANGDYLIADVEGGSHTVTADADGYDPASKEVTVDGDTQVDFALTATSTDDGGGGEVTPWGVDRTDADTVTETGAGIHAYVIDSGIDADHPDLVGNLGEGHAVEPCFKPGDTCDAEWDDDYDHGTHVAGTIGAADNDIDVVGVAPGVTLHAVKVLDRMGRSSTSEVIAGIDWVAGHNPGQARVANISLGRTGSKTGACTDSGFTGSDSFHEALCNATHTGVVFGVAAGNSGADAEGTVPAAYDDTVLTASATECNLVGEHGQTCEDGTDDWASFSNWGDDPADWTSNDSAPVAIGAPGVDVRSTWPDDEVHDGSGTSMAAPHVAGAAALFLADQAQTNDRSAFTNARQALLGAAEDTDPATTTWTNSTDYPHDEGFLDVGALLGGG